MISKKKKIGVEGDDSTENAVTVVKQATEKPTAGYQQRKLRAERQRGPSQHQTGARVMAKGPRQYVLHIRNILDVPDNYCRGQEGRPTYPDNRFCMLTAYDLLPRRPRRLSPATGTHHYQYRQATGEGSTRLKVAIDGPIHTVRLRQVPHAPNLAGSLICVLQLQDRENLMRTTKKGKLMLGLNEKAIGKAIRSEKGRL